MAIQLRNSVFVHIPKTGGRWVSEQLRGVTGMHYIGDPVYDAHVSPDTDLPVFAFVRHPVTMLNSLWMHRSKKHGNTRHKPWNWQQDHCLERECGDSDYFTFFERVAERPGIVTQYYQEFVEKYNCYTLWRMEDIAEQLIAALEYHDEGFDPVRIRAKANRRIGHGGNALPIVSRPEIVAAIVAGEHDFCERFEYTEEIQE